MRKLKLSTAEGQRVYRMGMRCIYRHLNQIYDSFSVAKQKAFDWCYDEYLATPNHDGFGIAKAGTFAFTASWVGTENGEDIMRVETSRNSYLVYLDK